MDRHLVQPDKSMPSRLLMRLKDACLAVIHSAVIFAERLSILGDGIRIQVTVELAERPADSSKVGF